MTTKERILEASLTLFSQKGYSGVSMKEIAYAIGIKDSSLYKHFPSKREIFYNILAEMTQKMESLTETLQIADATKGDASEFYSSLSTEMLVELSQKVFLFFLKNRFAARFRRMLNIEQYHDSVASYSYKKIFMEDSLDYQTLLFKQLIRRGTFKAAPPSDVAMNFYAPIFLLINLYDNLPEKEEEALERIKRHVIEFSRNYIQKK